MKQDQLDPRAREQNQRDNAQVAATRADQEIADIKVLMAERAGRRVMRGLLARTGIYRSSFTGNSETFFREGQRAIGLEYHALILAHCADDFLLMLKEQNEDA